MAKQSVILQKEGQITLLYVHRPAARIREAAGRSHRPVKQLSNKEVLK